MKTLPKVEISDDLDAQIHEGMTVSDFCKADVIRQALRIGLPQFAARFRPPPLWLEERIREALTEPAEATSAKEFGKTMAAIAHGRGQPAEEILKEADGNNLIVMGRKGRTALKDFLLGGVSSTVLHRCQNPTIAIVSSEETK